MIASILTLSPLFLLTESYDWSLPENYSSSGTFWVYGDSLGLRLFNSIRSRDLCTKLYSNCKTSYNWLYPTRNDKPVNNTRDNLDFRPEIVLNAIRSVLNTTDLQQPSSVLLLNLGLHYTRSVNFTTFQRVIGDVIDLLKEKTIDSQGKEVLKLKARVIWKSTTALC